MPSRYVVRSFPESSYLHVFNRGVEKREIFKDQQDYQIFIYYLFVYLAPLKTVLKRYPKLPLRLHGKNLDSQLNLIAYCLMPNHFHFLIKQSTIGAISKLMKQLTNAYTFYFNTKYRRVGGLMQGRFKTVLIDSDQLLLHISRYIHLNPIVGTVVKDLENHRWSSYLEYIGKHDNNLCKKEVILEQFPSVKDYERFVKDQTDYSKELDKLKHLTIDP